MNWFNTYNLFDPDPVRDESIIREIIEAGCTDEPTGDEANELLCRFADILFYDIKEQDVELLKDREVENKNT